ALKSGEYERLEADIRGVVEISKPSGVLLKVILETAYLTDDEKVEACRRAERAGRLPLFHRQSDKPSRESLSAGRPRASKSPRRRECRLRGVHIPPTSARRCSRPYPIPRRPQG